MNQKRALPGVAVIGKQTKRLHKLVRNPTNRADSDHDGGKSRIIRSLIQETPIEKSKNLGWENYLADSQTHRNIAPDSMAGSSLRRPSSHFSG
jgi:hypothetical protein